MRIHGGKEPEVIPPWRQITSNEKMGSTDKKTGLWLEELAAPYYILKEAGHEITLASPKGGECPIDAASLGEGFYTPEAKKFKEGDADAWKAFCNTVKLSDVNMADFGAVFYPGGHGVLWDLVDSAESIKILESAAKDNKPMALVCHGPAALKNVKGPGGESVVKGKKVGLSFAPNFGTIHEHKAVKTLDRNLKKLDGEKAPGIGTDLTETQVAVFSNVEEDQVQLTSVVPFLLEDECKAQGAVVS